MRLIQTPSLANTSILIIEQDVKVQNDRTWCFWEKKEGFFENIVHHRWNELLFHSSTQTIPLQIQPYQYKMIRGKDFYQYCKQQLQNHQQVTWLEASVTDVKMNNNQATVYTDTEVFTANYVFNSILFPASKKAFDASPAYKLLQHFKGWVIETPTPTFNPNQAYFMDFRVSQNMGTTFVYVLPISETKALVEYTFFNQQLLEQEQYDALLQNYLQQFWKLENYTIIETEFGIIPMTNFRFPTHQQSIIHIGTAGGFTKPSSGFTFQFIQKHSAAIVEALINNHSPVIHKSLWQQRFHWYDTTLLHVLHHQKMSGCDVFTQLFQKQKATTILRFLDNETTFTEELSILSSVPTHVFLPAAIQSLFPSA